MFIANDNSNIIKILKNIFVIYQRFLFKKKLIYFQKFQLNVILLNQYQSQKFGFYINKQNIHNKLFNELKLKEEHLKELARKFNEEEEKLYSFTPQINKEKIIFNPIKYYQNNISKISLKKNSKSFYNKSNPKYPISISYSNINPSKNISTNQFEQNLENSNFSFSENEPLYIYSLDVPKYISFKNKGNKSFNGNYKIRNTKKNLKNLYMDSLKEKKKEIFNNPSIKPFYTTTIPENLSLLFSSRLHINHDNINNNNNLPIKSNKIKKSVYENSSYSNYNEKRTNYISEKGSRTEHLSTINHELNNSKKKIENKKKNINQNNGFYPFRAGIIPYTYSNSYKSTHFVSPKTTERNNIITNRSNHFGTLSNYLENSRDDNKINTQNTIGKNTEGNVNANKLNDINFNSYFGNNKKNNNLEIQSNVVNETIINNENDSVKLSRKSSNSQITLQTISDNKLYDFANYYVNSDESLERFRFLNKYNQNKNRRININKNNYSNIYNKNNKIPNSPK